MSVQSTTVPRVFTFMSDDIAEAKGIEAEQRHRVRAAWYG
jgi:hypothetical protein